MDSANNRSEREKMVNGDPVNCCYEAGTGPKELEEEKGGKLISELFFG